MLHTTTVQGFTTLYISIYPNPTGHFTIISKCKTIIFQTIMSNSINLFHNTLVSLGDLSYTTFKILSLQNDISFTDKHYLLNIANRALELSRLTQIEIDNNMDFDPFQLHIIHILLSEIKMTLQSILHPIL